MLLIRLYNYLFQIYFRVKYLFTTCPSGNYLNHIHPSLSTVSEWWPPKIDCQEKAHHHEAVQMVETIMVCCWVTDLKAWPVFSYKLRYIVGFGLVEMAISTNPKPTIYRNLYENTDSECHVIWENSSISRQRLIILLLRPDVMAGYFKPLNIIKVFTHLKWCLATATHNFKCVEITYMCTINESKSTPVLQILTSKKSTPALKDLKNTICLT